MIDFPHIADVCQTQSPFPRPRGKVRMGARESAPALFTPISIFPLKGEEVVAALLDKEA